MASGRKDRLGTKKEREVKRIQNKNSSELKIKLIENSTKEIRRKYIFFFRRNEAKRSMK